MDREIAIIVHKRLVLIGVKLKWIKSNPGHASPQPPPPPPTRKQTISFGGTGHRATTTTTTTTTPNANNVYNSPMDNDDPSDSRIDCISYNDDSWVA